VTSISAKILIVLLVTRDVDLPAYSIALLIVVRGWHIAARASIRATCFGAQRRCVF
jgi:hypothetical protein